MENTFRVQLRYVYYKYLNVLYDVAGNFAKLTGNVKRLIFVSELQYHNVCISESNTEAGSDGRTRGEAVSQNVEQNCSCWQRGDASPHS